MNTDFFLMSALIDFVLLNGILSALSLAVERVTRPSSLRNWSARRHSCFLFVLTIAPFLLSLTIVAGLQIPAQLLYESGEPLEYVTAKTALLGLVGLLGAGFAASRQFASWWLTHRFHQQALEKAQPISPAGIFTALPVYTIKHTLPLCCIYGLHRPKLFLAEQLLAELDRPELRAAIAHEEAHGRRHDNLKHLCLSVLKNFFFFLPTYRRLGDSWREANELACDEEAAERTGAPLDLASALVKIARLTPPCEPSPGLLLQGLGLIDCRSSKHLEERILRLLSLADGFLSVEQRWRPSFFPWIASVGAFSALALLLVRHNLLYSLHRGIEVLERWFM